MTTVDLAVRLNDFFPALYDQHFSYQRYCLKLTIIVYPYRFGFPLIFRVSKDISFKELQLLIRREMPQDVRNTINKEVGVVFCFVV